MPDYLPYVPDITFLGSLETFQDAVDELADTLDGAAQTAGTRPHKQIVRAVLEAYRDLPHLHDWNYFLRKGVFNTVQTYSTGTIEYTASSRTLTLTGGTWPSWSRLGNLIIASKVYRVQERSSNTVLILDQRYEPGEDLASGTSYSIHQAFYPLPQNFIEMRAMVDVQNSWAITPTNVEGLLAISASNYTPSESTHYAIRSAGDYYGMMGVEFAPPPSDERTYTFEAKFGPRPLVTREYNTGTVDVTASSTAVTGTGTTWTSRMIGSVIRFPTDTSAAVTGVVGANPYNEQRVVVAVGSTTSLTLDSAVESAYSSSTYSISDPLDLDLGPMRTLFRTMVAEKYAQLNPRDRNPEEFTARKVREIRQAMTADSKHSWHVAGGTSEQYYYDLGDWAITTNTGMGATL